MLFVLSTAFGVFGTNPVSTYLLYAALAALVGVVIVAVGGGIKTMSRRWEAVSDTYDQEKPRIAESPRNAPAIKKQARQAKGTASQYASAADGAGNSSGGRGATRY
jgi:Flp pilus assembly pilin Flp